MPGGQLGTKFMPLDAYDSAYKVFNPLQYSGCYQEYKVLHCSTVGGCCLVHWRSIRSCNRSHALGRAWEFEWIPVSTKIYEFIADGTVIVQEHQEHANNNHVLDLECAPNLHV